MSHLAGDKYSVFLSYGRDTETVSVFDTWFEAKTERNSQFNRNILVRACWIMRHNESLGIRPEKYGETLRRRADETGT